VDDAGDVTSTVAVASRLVSADAGVLRPVVIVCDGQAAPPEELITSATRSIAQFGLDADVEVRYDSSVRDGLLHGVASHNSSFVVVPAATESWLPTLLGASQHALVADSPVPVALVRSGNAGLRRVVLVLSSAQARRPMSATTLAVEVAARLHKSGLHLTVVADGAARDGLFTPLADVTVLDAVGAAWIESQGAESDLVLVPGGRNGALATARSTKQAARRGATVVVVADARSVAALDAAEQGLALVPGRASPLAEP
jgi:hypothetical protein